MSVHGNSEEKHETEFLKYHLGSISESKEKYYTYLVIQKQISMTTTIQHYPS